LNRGVIPEFDRQVKSGAAVFCLALYLEGNGDAERLADRVARCQEKLFDAIAEDGREVVATSLEPAPFPVRSFAPPWRLSRLFRHGAPDTASTEAELINHVLDRSVATSPRNLPRPALAKLRDLQEAVTALRNFSADHNLGGTFASSTEIATVSFVPRGDGNKEPKPPEDQAVSVAKAESKGGTFAAARATASQTKNLAGAGVGSNGQVLTLPGTSSGGRALVPPAKQDEERSISAPSAPNPRPSDKPSLDFTKQFWYFIASIWGAVFTYVLAPLVVDILRQRLKKRRLRRSSALRTPIPAEDVGSYILAAPEALRHAKPVKLLHRPTDPPE
jgi:hypothetical protein